MAGPLRTKLQIWRESSKGLKSRLDDNVKDSALNRTDVRTSLVENKIDRGNRVQSARLKFYPSIDVDFETVYAGSIEGSTKDAKDALMQIGFRNGPLGYVEVTEEFGPDDGSFWLHIVSETGKFPFIDNRVGAFRRIKDQIHTVIWEDKDRGMTHLGAHRERSAILQPARHAVIRKGDAARGVRDLRNKWSDELGEGLPRPLSIDLPD